MKSLYEILVPTHYQNGEYIDISVHEMWDKKVREISGGMTILRSAIGEWHNFRERMIPVRLLAEKEQILDLVKFTQQHYRQISVMAYKLSDEIIIYDGNWWIKYDKDN